MAQAPKCKLCGSSHWSSQGHRFKEPVTQSNEPVIIGVEAVTERNVPRPPGPISVTRSNEACAHCGKSLEPRPRYCSTKCKQAAYRKSRPRKHGEDVAKQKAWRGH